jgi:hypothetical protein
MPSVIVATPKGLTSNSYVTLAEGDAYFDDRLYSSTWSTATAEDRIRALLWSAKILDTRIVWNGYKSDFDQSMQWPRGGVYEVGNDEEFDPLIVPDFLKWAQCEQAITLLSNSALMNDPEYRGISSLSISGAVSLSFDKSDAPEVLPRSVRDLCRHYGIIEEAGSMKTLKVARS